MTQIEWDVQTKPEIIVEPHRIDIRVARHPQVVIRVKHLAKNSTGTRIDKNI